MLSSKTGLLAFCAGLFLATNASGDNSTAPRLYSAASLNTLWANTVSAQPLTSLTTDQYKTSLASTAPPLSTPTAPTVGGSKKGWKPPSTQTAPTESVYFHVVDVSPSLESELVSRQVALGMFLNKSDFYQEDRVPVSDTGTVDQYADLKAQAEAQTRVVSLRRYSARLELFLMGMIRYFTVDSVIEKCGRVTELRDLLAQLDAMKTEIDGIRNNPGNTATVDARFATLEPLVTDVVTRYRGQINEAVACQVTPASSRKSDLAAATLQLETALNSDLTNSGPLKTMLDAINQVQASFAGVQNQVSGIKPYSNELLQLELSVSNAVANFNMVRSDALQVAAKVALMDQKVNIASIKNLGGMTPEQLRKIDDLGRLDAATTTMNASLTALLTALKTAPTSVGPVLDPTNSLQVCGQIDPAAFLAATTPDTAAIKNCLTSLKALVDTAAQQSLLQQEMTEFSNKVKAMSPEIIRDRSGH